ncbi:MAG: c-type cytochrome [Candidatus Melainabacteria bacterium]|nr:c-type cytochrome [Candidatus Melainabacteria bacterium]
MLALKLKFTVALLLFFVVATPVLVARAEKNEGHGKLIKPLAFKPLAKDKQSERGKTLFSKHQCSTCHTIQGRGGCLAPPLDGVGARRSGKFMNARIVAGGEQRFSDMYGISELMPHVRIPASDASAIVRYLLTIPSPKLGFHIVGHSDTKDGAPRTAKVPDTNFSSSSESIKRGRELLTSKGCLACHSLGNLGGTFAEKFDKVGSRLTREAIMQQMRNADLLTLNDGGEYGARGTVMPPLGLSDKEIEDLANYLITLK